MKYPIAKESSIKRTEELLATLPKDYGASAAEKDALLSEAKEYGPNAARRSLNIFSYNRYIYRYTYGELLYKRGQWDDAEAVWLQLLPFNTNVAESLAKMYSREHRFKDEISILRLGIREWQSSPFSVYGLIPDNLNSRLNKALAKHHRQSDQSIGFTYDPLPYDRKFTEVLRNMVLVGEKNENNQFKLY